jgi:hypothetical protein
MIRSLVIGLLLLFSAERCCAAGANGAAAFDPVEAGENGLSRVTRFPWYDRTKRELKPVSVIPSRDSISHRESKWIKAPAKPPTPGSWNWGNWNWSGAGNSVFSVLGWALLALVLAGLVFVLGWALLQRDRIRRKQKSKTQELQPGKEADTVQIENLPFPLEPTELDLLSEARRLYQAGECEKAIIYLFSYQLVQLDHRQLVRLTRGKTNRQYLRELRTHPFLRSIVEQTMIRFEDVFFGGRNLSRAQFASCWDRLNDFHQHVEQPAT